MCWCARCPYSASPSAPKARSATPWWRRCSTCRPPNTALRAACRANSRPDFDDNTPYTPAWQEQITGVPRDQVIAVARQFAENAEKTEGRSMVIIGAGMNHWYHSDMNYRGVINMLMMCGCIGKSGGGWSHYVARRSCGRRPAGPRLPSRSTGSARRAR